MVVINWTLNSTISIDQIAEFIAVDSFHYAKKFVNDVFKKVKILETQPYVGKIVPELNKENIRQLLFGKYRIIYHIKSEKEVDILTVHHSARLLDTQSITITEE